MFINYDEWGGFFDHVSPPFVPDGRRDRRNLEEDWGFCGFRVPGVAISPYTRGGRVSHMRVTHESILKLISYRFGLGHLNRRHKFATNIGRSFNWRKPNFNRPSLPDPNAILATPCILQPGAQPERAKPHDLNDLETSGYLDRLGYDVPEATLDKILRYPDAARRAIAAGNAAGASG